VAAEGLSKVSPYGKQTGETQDEGCFLFSIVPTALLFVGRINALVANTLGCFEAVV
jgi:hypothetical protein